MQNFVAILYSRMRKKNYNSNWQLIFAFGDGQPEKESEKKANQFCLLCSTQLADKIKICKLSAKSERDGITQLFQM